MGKKYLAGSLFDVLAASVAKLHLEIQGDLSVEHISREIWQGYSTFLVDDGCIRDLAFAAQEALEQLKDEDQPIAILHSFRYWRSRFKLSGKRRPFWHRGIGFDPQLRNQEEGRVVLFLARLIAYRVMIDEGRAPLAPRGWSL